MAYPIVQSWNEGKNAGGTSVNVTTPGGLQAGDLLIGILVSDGKNETHGSPESDTWTDIYASYTEGTNLTISVWYKIATGSEGPTLTFTNGSSEALYALVLRIDGQHSTDIIHKQNIGDGDSSSVIMPAVNTTEDECLILRIFGADHHDVTIDGGWASVTNISVDESDTGNGAASGGVGRENQVSAGDTGTETNTLTAVEEWIGITLAIRPAGVGPIPQLCQLTVVGTAGTKKKTKKDFTLAIIGTSGTKKKTKKSFALTVIGTATMSRFIDVARSFLLVVQGVTTMSRSIDVARTFQLVVQAVTTSSQARKFFRTCQLIVTATTGLGNFLIKKAISLVIPCVPTMTRFIDVARFFKVMVTGSTSAKKKTKKDFHLVITAVTTCTAFRKFFQLCQLVITAVPTLAKKISKKIHMEIGGGVGVAGVQEATFKRMQSHGD